MKINYFKLQIQRLFDDWKVTIWIFLGISLALYHQLSTPIPPVTWDPHPTAYTLMIGFDLSSLSSLYFLMMPLIASLVALACISDHKNGHVAFFEISRLGKVNYIVLNVLATFLVGGLIVELPLLFDNLIALTRLQGLTIDPFTVLGQNITTTGPYFYFFLNHPLAYWFAYQLLTFFFGGLYTSIIFLVYYLTHKKSIAIIGSFAFYLFVWIILSVLGRSGASSAVFLIAEQGYEPKLVRYILLNSVFYLAILGLFARIAVTHNETD